MLTVRQYAWNKYFLFVPLCMYAYTTTTQRREPDQCVYTQRMRNSFSLWFLMLDISLILICAIYNYFLISYSLFNVCIETLYIVATILWISYLLTPEHHGQYETLSELDNPFPCYHHNYLRGTSVKRINKTKLEYCVTEGESSLYQEMVTYRIT